MSGIGKIEVVCGPMFSGKSEELIRRATRVEISDQKYVAFKPEIDNRYEKRKITSHNGRKLDAQTIAVDRPLDIMLKVSEDISVVVIDDLQFFTDERIVSVVRSLSIHGKRVIVAGLDLDFRAEPFGFMPQLLAIANEVDKLKAICMVCKEDGADRTQRIVNGEPAFYEDPIIIVGAKESYEARCGDHHKVRRRSLSLHGSP